MIEVVIDATRSAWTVDPHHGRADVGRKSIVKDWDAVMKAADWTCQGCGLRCDRYLEVHNIDGDHDNNSMENRTALCPLCHQVFHPIQARITSAGDLIWFPELSQEKLNQALVAIFCAQAGDDPALRATASQIFGWIQARQSVLEAALGTSDPGILAQVLIGMSSSERQTRAETLSGIRMLAQPSGFREQVSYWAKGRFAKVDTSALTSLVEAGEVAPNKVPVEFSHASKSPASQGLPVGFDMADDMGPDLEFPSELG